MGGKKQTMTPPSSSTTRRGLLATGVGLTGLALSGCFSPATEMTRNAARADSTPLAPDDSDLSGAEISILDDNTNLVFKDGLIDAFEKQTGITVKNYEMANFNDLHDRFATLFAAQDASVDVVMTFAGWSAEFGQALWLQPLADRAVPKDVIHSSLDSVSWNGTVYGLPKFSSVQTMFWNKDHFVAAGIDPDTAPESWDDFVAAAKAVTTSDRFGFCCDMGNPAGAYQNFLRALLLSGGELYDEDWNPQLDSDAAVEGLTKMVELLHTHKVMDPASLQITNASDLVDVFAQERTSIVFNWPFQWASATARDAKTSTDSVGNGLLPGINVRSASIDGSEGYAISKYSGNKQAALKWLQFAASATSQSEIVRKEGWFPVSQKILAAPETEKELPAVKTYEKSTKYATKRYGAPWSNELDQLLSVQVFKAMNQDVEPAEALKQAQSHLVPIVDEYMR